MYAKEVHIIPYHSSFLPNSQGHGGAVRKRDTSSCTIVPCHGPWCVRTRVTRSLNGRNFDTSSQMNSPLALGGILI